MPSPVHVYQVTLSALDSTEGSTATQVSANAGGGRVKGLRLRRTSITGGAAQLTVELFTSSTAGNSGNAIFSKVFGAATTPIYPAADGDTVEVECGNLVYFEGANLYYNAWTDAGTFTGSLNIVTEPNDRVRVS